MDLIHFRGIDIIPSKIIAVSEIKIISTGDVFWEWEYGFTLHCDGKDFDFPIPTVIDSDGNHVLKKEERKVIAASEKLKLIKLIEDFDDKN